MAFRRVDFAIASGGGVGSLCASRCEVTWLKMWRAAATRKITSIFFVLGGVLPSMMASLTSVMNSSLSPFKVTAASWLSV